MKSKAETKNPRQKARIFLAEAHGITRLGLAMLVHQLPDMEICGESGSAPAAGSAIGKLKPDLALVGLVFKDGSGLELIRTCRAQDDALRILVVTRHPESLHAEAALRAGALGYVMKDEPVEKILAAIRHTLNGRRYLSESMILRLVEQGLDPKSAERGSDVESLSDREKQVLQMIGEWRPTCEIARLLCISIKTVEFYRSRIKEKLHLANAKELTQYATEWCRGQSQIEQSSWCETGVGAGERLDPGPEPQRISA